MSIQKSFSRIIIPLLEIFLILLSKLFEVDTDVLKTSDPFHCSLQGLEWGINDELGGTSWQDSDGKAIIIDADKDFKPSVGNQRDGDSSLVGIRCTSEIFLSSVHWRSNMISIISSFYFILSDLTCHTLVNLLRNEMDTEVTNILCVKKLCHW